MLMENGTEEASLIVVLRIKSHAFCKPEWIFHDTSPFLIIVISVVFVEHSLAEGVGLAFFAFPFWYGWPSLIPESRVVLALAAMEYFPL